LLVICDTETNALENPDKLWLVVCKEVESGALHVFKNVHESPSGFRQFATKVTGWIGHNFIGFDRGVLRSLGGINIPPEAVVDTLVVSRLLNYGQPGGHSLESIGERLGIPKGNFKDFSALTKEMEDYCIQDVEITYRYFLQVKPFIYSGQWKDALRLEHDMAFICEEMKDNGFHFDKPKAVELLSKITTKVNDLSDLLQKEFPPRSVLLKEITPKGTKFGTISKVDFRWTDDLTPYSIGHPFSRIEWVPFNPGSPKQVVERLNEAGWKPYEKTKGHIQAERERNEEKLANYRITGWSVSEANLSTLPQDAPEGARRLAEWLLINNRRNVLEQWLSALSEADNRIHGSFFHIGAWTHRMSHSNPNMANIPSGDSLYAEDMRSLWNVPKDRLLVGVDADGIQLRILAHYMNDPEFTEALINGQKENGTDAHSLNKEALGYVCKDRDTAKTFIYAWLLGAGTGKIAQILGCSHTQAKQASDNFLSRYPGLKALKEVQIPRDAAKGYFQGIDGRLVFCDSEHLMLAGYLQNGESVAMKRANVLWRRRLITEGIDFKQVNFVHDEWQLEVPHDYELAKYIANVQADSLRIVGEELKLRCPLAGSTLNSHKQLAIGQNWSQTH